MNKEQTKEGKNMKIVMRSVFTLLHLLTEEARRNKTTTARIKVDLDDSDGFLILEHLGNIITEARTEDYYCSFKIITTVAYSDGYLFARFEDEYIN